MPLDLAILFSYIVCAIFFDFFFIWEDFIAENHRKAEHKEYKNYIQKLQYHPPSP